MRNGAANRIENLDAPLMDRATNTMLQKMQETLIYNATHDPVTDLLTRDAFAKQFKHEIGLLGNSSHVLCHIEVQDYRLITNSCGVTGGNQLLKKLTHLLTGQLRNEELFARLGDKTFGILFKHCSPDEGFEIAKKLVNTISDSHFEWEDKSYPIGVNIGLAPVTGNGYDVNQLMQQADSASISAKDSGHNRIQLFKEDDERLKRQKKVHEWAGQIDRVLAENRIFIRCQKIVPVEPDNDDYSHYEILMGVRDNVGNFVPPDHFIPAAECCQRMAEIDQWIIRHVFGWIEQNRNFFDQIDGFSINLSGQSINTEEFLVFLKELLASSNVPPQKITFEITESVAADSLVYVKKFIKQIKQFGCKFSLDDFGSGYSSYSYLKNLNVDYLKIDGAFVKDMANNPADVAIVKSMNEIAHSLGMLTIAEYVENDEIRTILTEIGVDYVQGYGIQKPILLTDLVVVPGFAEDSRLAEALIAAKVNTLAEDHNVAEIDDLTNNLSTAETTALTEDQSVVGIDALAENHILSGDNDLLEDNEFWGF
jgi:diguanylate cyclase (GGDEF)-like protein